jgi:hypothetical protein
LLFWGEALNENETISPKTLSYDGKTVTIILDGGLAERTISLSSDGALFTVNSGVTLTLGNNITLQGKSNNYYNEPQFNYCALVKVETGGTLIMNSGSRISGNNNYNSTSSSRGGGVFVGDNGTFIMNGGTISGNTARSSRSYAHGGGVYVEGYNGVFTMNGGTISGNTAKVGGGVYVTRGSFTKTGGTIYGSDADSTLKNTATGGSATYGHAAYVSLWYRDETAGENVDLYYPLKGGDPTDGNWKE